MNFSPILTFDKMDLEHQSEYNLRYLNAQLGALHQNARKAIGRLGTQLKVDEVARGHVALGEYYYLTGNASTTEDATSYFRFDTPEIVDFITSSKLRLRLRVNQDSYYNPEYKLLRSGRNVTPDFVHVEFEVNFDTRQAGYVPSEQGLHTINVLILDLYSPIVISPLNEPLRFYFSQYLRYLQDEGHNMLYTLPYFKKTFPLSPRTPSVRAATPLPELDIRPFNSRLRLAWFKAALTALNTSRTHGKPTVESICLAEYSAEEYDTRLDVKFGIPEIYVSGNDVFLRLTITEGVLYTKRGISWNVVDRIDGTFTIKINVRNHAKVELYFALEELNNRLLTCFDAVLHHRRERLTSFLEKYALVCNETILKAIAGIDESTPHFDSEIYGGLIAKDAQRLGLVNTPHVHSFDYVQVLDRYSLIQQFQTLHSSDVRGTYQWTHRLADSRTFHAHFGPLRVRLLSDNKALVWICPKELSGSSLTSSFVFKDLALAFEVPLKTSDEEIWSLNGPSSVFRFHVADTILHHLCLDLEHAEFVLDLSNLGELLTFANDTDLQTIGGLVNHLWRSYSKQLVENGQHILLSTPVFKAGASPADYILTTVKGFTYSKLEVTRCNFDKLPASVEPALIVVGMCGYRPFPIDPVKILYELTCDGANKNSLFISRKCFLEEHILRLFDSINDKLSKIAFPTAGGNLWNQALSAFVESPEGRQLQFKIDGNNLFAEWTLRKQEKITETYDISCEIVNKLFIEIGRPNIQMTGTLSIKSIPKDGLSASMETRATWNPTLSFVMENGALVVRSDGSLPKVYSSNDARTRALGEDLKTKVISSVSLAELEEEFRAEFCSAWQTCVPRAGTFTLGNPVMNSNGDVVFESYYSTVAAAKIVSTVVSSNGNGSDLRLSPISVNGAHKHAIVNGSIRSAHY
ncbi:hypothetical protein NEOLEDRAFT_1180314 [Neolentinus lepideus HHB14362 ss-1]|uniref:Uncharacterized protein n=1 Tax=Neolentinus lepideus HHB14362 ss-1 TaxID=1314782 RepID=A0A165QYX8_9AGAM|nr:hypothetical protein NEOLEDRAFT_1180314 [Neolentinus lepideus HHB14362 ss-1]